MITSKSTAMLYSSSSIERIAVNLAKYDLKYLDETKKMRDKIREYQEAIQKIERKMDEKFAEAVERQMPYAKAKQEEAIAFMKTLDMCEKEVISKYVKSKRS